MCGIAGLFDTTRRAGTQELESIAGRMAETLVHRGPDDQGTWADAASGMALGHRRLSIVDLSAAGHQPMTSACGRYTLCYNGEIYNYADIRQLLVADGRNFRGHSDSEILVEAIAAWGVEAAVSKAVGMFAFAVCDVRERSMTLVRDRLGIKPLYYGWLGTTFVFASELKALRAHPEFRGEIDRGALALYLRHNEVPAPYSIYRGIAKLPPGTTLTIAADSATGRPRPTPYWSLQQVVERGRNERFRGSPEEAVERLDAVLRDAVLLRREADVPLGAFLSGGIDSSTVVAMLQAQAGRRITTFSIGFKEPAYDEAPYAAAVARHLGTEHVEHYVSPEQAREVIPRLPRMFDEPFADSSQIPTFLVSQFARQHVTVSLSGDGGDELFGGYERYFHLPGLWRRVGWAPAAMRLPLAHVMRAVASPSRGGTIARKTRTLAELLSVPDAQAMYTTFNTHWRDAESVAMTGSLPPTVHSDRGAWAIRPDLLEQMMLLDTLTYLPDDILVKVDRASMAVGLEARVPVLDHRVVEFAWTLPAELKVRDGQSKWILRQVLDRYVPRSLVERPKVGFGVPIDQWLRGPLRDWAESLIDEGRLRQEGYFRPEPIREKWAEHLAGHRDWHYHLWDVLMFQAWQEAS